MQTTSLRLLNDARYESFCDYDKMVLSTLLEAPPGWPDLGSYLRELASRLTALHNPHGHRLLYQSLRLGPRPLRIFPAVRIPSFRRSFTPLPRQSRVTASASARDKMPYGVAIAGRYVSTAVGRYVCTATASTPATCIPGMDFLGVLHPAAGQHDRGTHGEGTLSFGAPGMLTTPALPAELSVRPETRPAGAVSVLFLARHTAL